MSCCREEETSILEDSLEILYDPKMVSVRRLFSILICISGIKNLASETVVVEGNRLEQQ